MKKVIVLSLALFVFNSCGGKKETEEVVTRDTVQAPPAMRKHDVHMQPMPMPNGEMFQVEYTQHAIDSILKAPAVDRPATPEAAAQYHLSIPPKMTVPPHMLPAKDIKLKESTDSTATFTFGSHNPQLNGSLMLYKVEGATGSVWLVKGVAVTHKTP